MPRRRRTANSTAIQNEYERDSIDLVSSSDDDDGIQVVDEVEVRPRPAGCWGTRHTFALLGFLGFANVYAMRVNLSVAIVAMVKEDPNNTKTDIGHECPILNDTYTNHSMGPGPQYEWDSKEQGLILGSFFYGYVITQIPGGFIAEKWGGKWVYGIGCFFTAILTLLTPLFAELGVIWFIILRVFEGLGEGVTYPSMHALMSKWVPKSERGRMVAFISAGAQFGTFVGFPISSLLASQLGWPSVFYFFGTLGVLWFIFWVFLVFSTPQSHPRITNEERSFIESEVVMSGDHFPDGKLPPPPLKSILTSVPFITLIMIHVGNNWGFYTLLTETPTYLQNIQHSSLQDNGFMSGLPYLFMFLLSSPFGRLADLLVSSGKLSLTRARKVMEMIGIFIPALGFVGLAFTSCNKTLAVFWLCASVASNSACYSGHQCNFMELSPNYTGTLMGITNMIGNFPGFIAPYVSGAIVEGNQTFAAWREVFLISTAIYLALTLPWLIFGTTEVQPWNTYWKDELSTSRSEKEKERSTNQL